MAIRVNNRYTLFGEAEVDASLIACPVINTSENPFLNQIADDSSPWQEVKKHNTSMLRPPPPASKGQNLGDRDQTRVAIAHSNMTTRARTASASTLETVDKIKDPHQNWCGVCSLKFSNKAALLNHVKQTPDHKHYCNMCKRVFKDRNGLKNHLDNALYHEVHCNLCLSAFNNEWGLKNHFENNYTIGHEFACLTCLLGFHSQAELVQHLRTAEKHIWCGACHRRFSTQDERDEHWQKTAKHKHCLQPGCEFDGPNQVALHYHLAKDHFQCVGCKRIFPSQTKLNHHSEACTFAIACPQCRHPCAGQAQLALHLEHCFFCEDCSFSTHHEGNYKIHMTKHASATIPCWGCEAPMRTYSSLINHLESGKCPKFHDPSRLVLCLGKWWYSPLYMDLDLHAHIRTGRINMEDMRQWMDEGSLHPFLCRDDTCQKTFGHLSSLVLHCESQACGWDIARLNIPGLEQEFKQLCMRRDSGTT